MISRRSFLLGSAVLATVPALPPLAVPALAEAPPKRSGQAPGFFRLEFGDVEVTALYDGGGAIPQDILHGAPAKDISGLLADACIDPAAGSPLAINAFLLNTGANLVLVDTGAGTFFGTRAGLLPANLRAAGYAPEDVDTVLITHLHVDHALGLAGADGEAAFPKAVVRVRDADAAYWLDDALPAKVPEAKKPGLTALRAAVAPYRSAGTWKPFAAGETPVAGVAAMPLPGHTPGHTGFRVDSQGKSLLLFGDIIHVAAVQFPKPSVTIDFDVDQPAARAARARLMAQAVKECWTIGGAHLPFPGLGRIRPQGQGYAWLPVPYEASRA
uniref:Zn-dependent hydrolase, glyoxylase n=1 Tax=Desulfovibrio sp. U5L TaxID=596152 RepID=I2Q721_9BACT